MLQENCYEIEYKLNFILEVPSRVIAEAITVLQLPTQQLPNTNSMTYIPITLNHPLTLNIRVPVEFHTHRSITVGVKRLIKTIVTFDPGSKNNIVAIYQPIRLQHSFGYNNSNSSLTEEHSHQISLP